MTEDGHLNSASRDRMFRTPPSRSPAGKGTASAAGPASVYQVLRAAIIEGRIRPGERLQAKRFSRLFGVSETPVREALIRLHMENLIAASPNHGFYSKALEAGELAQLYAVAHTLLTNAISSSKDSFDGDGLDLLIAAGRKAEDSFGIQDHVPTLAHAIERLFIRIAKLSRNNHVVRIIREFNARTHLVRLIDLEDDARGLIVTSMHRLTKTLGAGDRGLALEELQTLFRRRLDLLPRIADAANRRMLEAPLP